MPPRTVCAAVKLNPPLLMAMLVLVAPAALACSPAEFKPYRVSPAHDSHLALSVRNVASVLTRDWEVIWALPLSSSRVMFTSNAESVVFASSASALTIVQTHRDAKPVTVSPVEALTDDERFFIPWSTCGSMWFEAWAPAADGIDVSISQNAQGRPTEAREPPVVVHIAADGTVTRRTPKLQVDLLSLTTFWSGSASPERERVIESIVRQASTPSGATQTRRLGSFIRRVFDTADSTGRELELAATLVGALAEGNQRDAAEAVLKRPGSESGLLAGLRGSSFAQEVAARVFPNTRLSSQARASALWALSDMGQAPYSTALAAGLRDDDEGIREMAADVVARTTCSASMLTDVQAALQKESAARTSRPDPKFTHQRMATQYEMALRNCQHK